MGKEIKWIGLKDTIRALNAEAGKIELASRKALLKSGLIIKNKSVPITPIDTGNLRESAFIVYGGGKGRGAKNQTIATNNFNTEEEEGKRVANEHEPTVNSFALRKHKTPFATIGYTAFYAEKEHETSGEKHAEGTDWKFLERALLASKREVLSILEMSIRKTVKRQGKAARKRFFEHFTK
jgi:hypothetical protein